MPTKKKKDIPTGVPTSKPSYMLGNYQNNRGYRTYLQQQGVLTSQSASGVMFSSFYYKGTYVEGNCQGWTNYLNSYLQLPYDNAYFSQVSATFAFYDISLRATRTKVTSCSEPQMLANMVAAFKSGEDFEKNCNYHSWRVYTCPGSGPLVCINCKRSCERSESCPEKNYYINPCQRTCRSVYKGIGSNIQFTYAFRPLHPEYISPLALTANKRFIDVAVNVTKAGRIYCAALPVGIAVQSLVAIRNPAYGGSTGQGFMKGMGIVDVRIEPLGPDTPYDVYCYTEDYASHVMPLTDCLAAVGRIKTPCCRTIVFPPSFPRIPDLISADKLVLPQLSFSLDAPPTFGLVVTMSIKSHPCEGMSFHVNFSMPVNGRVYRNDKS